MDGTGQARIQYATEHEHLVVTTPLEGEAFEADNGKVWLVLKDLMLRGLEFAYISHIDQFWHGRAAIKALRAHYEGNLAMSQTRLRRTIQLRMLPTVERSGTGHSKCMLHYTREAIK